jgi:D-glycero-D-manno-heptose 1,7-bisphosphate phosphatase
MALPRVAPRAPANRHEVVTGGLRRAVFLDRDGVINRAIVREGKPHAAASLERLEILPGVRESLGRLRAAGYLNIVVTNQPDVGAGRMERAVVESMHARLLETLPIDAVNVCYHIDADNCECRKPKAGMILEAARELRIDLAQSFLVGDRWRDIAAGQRAGCRTFFVDYRYAEKRPDKPYLAVESLPSAVSLILQSPAASGPGVREPV